MAGDGAGPQKANQSNVVLGTYAVPVTTLTVTDTMNAPSTGTVTVQGDAIAGAPAEYRSMAKIRVAGDVILAGWVINARHDGDAVVLDLSNGPLLEEVRIDQFALVGVPIPERVWTIGQLAGIKPENLHIQGLTAFPELIVTAMPVEGLALSEDSWVGSVRLTVDRELIALMARRLPDSPIKTRLLESRVWAVVRGVASMLLPAESSSVSLIEAAIDRIALGAQYSLASDPNGSPVAFNRPALLTDPVALRVALVHGEASKRTWVRTLDNPPVVLPVAARRVEVPAESGGTLLEAAIRAWRRAMRTKDGIAAAGALFEAVEFYVGDLTLPPVVARSKVREVCRAVAGLDLDDVERRRVTDVLAWVNRPPLRARFLAALAADRVPYTEDEIVILWRLREVRNNAVHGATAGEPEANDLEVGRALVNRMLVFRAMRAQEREGPRP